MNALQKLIDQPDYLKKEKGIEHTPGEIQQQPETWAKATRILLDRREEILEFMEAAGLRGDGQATLILTGAGSSEFVGNAVANLIRRTLKRETLSIPTTHLVTHPASAFIPGRPYVVVSFARSGNSPESVATYDRVWRHCPDARQIVITCNKEGALAKRASEDPNALSLVLPEETHDRSLVMTSSYSTMAWTAAGLGLLENPKELRRISKLLQQGGEQLLQYQSQKIADFARIQFDRACYLGSNTLFGTMQECALKLQEMSDGSVATRFESFLGLRHGPQVFVDETCVVIASVSSNPAIRRYEVDMLRELQQKGQGCGTMVVCARADDELKPLCTHLVELYPEGEVLGDGYRVMTDVMVGQILGTFKSLSLGLKPDAPSAAGTINRVVQGVVIYDE